MDCVVVVSNADTLRIKSFLAQAQTLIYFINVLFCFQYIKDQYGPLSECLESVLSVKAKEDLASAMVHVLHHEGLAKEFIAELALQEILKSGM